MTRDEGFVSRWARRKAEARAGRPADDAPLPATTVDRPAAPPVPAPDAIEPPVLPTALAEPAAEAPAPPPLPTLDDVAALASDAADFSRFVAPQVSSEVRNAAMKKLFTDPHFNLMDGLDVYIDDYSQPDPIPKSMLRSLVQSQLLGLFAEDPPAAQPGPAPAQVDAAADAQPAIGGDTTDVAVEEHGAPIDAAPTAVAADTAPPPDEEPNPAASA